MLICGLQHQVQRVSLLELHQGVTKHGEKLRAAVARMSLKSLILGRVARENEIYLFVCGNCTAPSVSLSQTL